MPRISEFYGIVIAMFWDDHPAPHFHAFYAEHRAKVSIADGLVMEGHLPKRALRLVRQWADLHQGELMTNWEKAARRLPLDKIEPLP